jgi:hypothetical protein
MQRRKIMAKTISKTTKKAKKASSKAGGTLSFITNGVQEAMDAFASSQQVDSTLTAAERRRLVSAGVKNYEDTSYKL